MSSEWEEEEELTRQSHAKAWRVGLAVFLLLFAAALLWAFLRYPPYAGDQKNIKEAHALMEKVNAQGLNSAEFDRVVELLHCGTEAAELCAINILEIFDGRYPWHRERVLIALEGCREHPSPVVREQAARMLEHVKAKPKWQ